MKYIPNVLSFSRIILSIVLFYLNPVRLPFILIYIICGITDMLDGFIARKINATSEFGAKLDSVADMLIIHKIDGLDYFDFDLEACKKYVRRLNPNIRIIPISARTGEGIAEWTDWLRSEIRAWNEG